MYVLRPLTSGRQAARASEASESQSVSMLNKTSSARTADEDVQEEAAAELVPFKRTAMLTPCCYRGRQIFANTILGVRYYS